MGAPLAQVQLSNLPLAYLVVPLRGCPGYVVLLLHLKVCVWLQESDFFKQLKAAQPFFVMAGPNVIQSEEHVLKLARQIKAVTDKLGLLLVFKSSFDKANRTNATSFRGPGLEEGLR